MVINITIPKELPSERIQEQEECSITLNTASIEIVKRLWISEYNEDLGMWTDSRFHHGRRIYRKGSVLGVEFFKTSDWDGYKVQIVIAGASECNFYFRSEKEATELVDLIHEWIVS